MTLVLGKSLYGLHHLVVPLNFSEYDQDRNFEKHEVTGKPNDRSMSSSLHNSGFIFGKQQFKNPKDVLPHSIASNYKHFGPFHSHAEIFGTLILTLCLALLVNIEDRCYPFISCSNMHISVVLNNI